MASLIGDSVWDISKMLTGMKGKGGKGRKTLDIKPDSDEETDEGNSVKKETPDKSVKKEQEPEEEEEKKEYPKRKRIRVSDLNKDVARELEAQYSDNESDQTREIGRAVQQECRDRSRMPSSA
eukprot:TRINITY_DN34401_c0_g2_i2.p1 TRINITY_DN34401_c0_g2~~TRINITY_DN34401_c0_g2_i2.p1  ORF type:complete len:123 (-),score=31.79 TRINITY_DN34401_c0_g2_i2:11-379(-)